MAEKDKVVGKALYAELRQGGQTYQILITPDGIASNGKNVSASMYRRQISMHHARKGWKQYGLPNLPVDGFGSYTKMTTEQALDAAGSRAAFFKSTLNQLATYQYRVYKQPIFVEVSVEDLDTIRAGKTPYKVLGRITRVRRALGFGEELFVS